MTDDQEPEKKPETPLDRRNRLAARLMIIVMGLMIAAYLVVTLRQMGWLRGLG